MAYCTRAEVRALDVLQGSPAAYTDAMIDEAILWATQLIDLETGTTWEYKTQTVTRDGNASAVLDLGVIYPRAITSVTEAGVAATTTGWALTDTGLIRRPTGTFPTAIVGRNIVVTFTAGVTAVAPPDIASACRALSRWYCLQLLSRTPANVLQTVTDMGTTTHVQPGGPYNNATALPEVNATLRRRNHKIPGVG